MADISKPSMPPATLRQQLQGVIAFPVTPFHQDLSLDLEGLRHNLKALLKHPVCAVVAAAGTGELYSLTPEEHLQVVQTTVEEVDGTVPVLAGTGFGHTLAIQLARHSAQAGADGILAFPAYYPTTDTDGIFDYYAGIASATSLGMLIYTRDWANYSPAVAARLSEIPNLIAWKDGQGDIRRFQMIQEALGDRYHWIGGAGDDLVPGYYSIGIRTYTSSIANVAPRLSLQLHEAAASGNRETLSSLMQRYVIPLYTFRTRRKGYEVSAMKWMMDQAGLKGGPVRPPLLNVTSQDAEDLRNLTKPWASLG